MNAQSGGRTNEVAFVSPQDFGDKASLEMLRGFGKEDAFLNHFPANIFQALFEPKRWLCFAFAHAALLLLFQESRTFLYC